MRSPDSPRHPRVYFWIMLLNNYSPKGDFLLLLLRLLPLFRIFFVCFVLPWPESSHVHVWLISKIKRKKGRKHVFIKDLSCFLNSSISSKVCEMSVCLHFESTERTQGDFSPSIVLKIVWDNSVMSWWSRKTTERDLCTGVCLERRAETSDGLVILVVPQWCVLCFVRPQRGTGPVYLIDSIHSCTTITRRQTVLGRSKNQKHFLYFDAN